MTLKDILDVVHKAGIDNLDIKIYMKPEKFEHPFIDELTEQDEIKDFGVISSSSGDVKIYLEK